MEKNPYEVSQESVMLNVLYKEGSFTELELGEMISGKRQRGARSFIAVARKNGHQIAHKFTVNVVTGRLNRSYYLENDDIENALIEYEKASQFYPQNPELPYWAAITMASKGNLDKALPIFLDVFKREPRLRTLTPRLVNSGLLPDDKQMLKKILEVR